MHYALSDDQECQWLVCAFVPGNICYCTLYACSAFIRAHIIRCICIIDGKNRQKKINSLQKCQRDSCVCCSLVLFHQFIHSNCV